MPSNRLIHFHFHLLLLSVFPSIRAFSTNLAPGVRWSNYWRFNLSISPSNEDSGLISFRIDWSDLLAVQGTLKSVHQHHSSKASILQRSDFFMVQLSHPHMILEKLCSAKSLQSCPTLCDPIDGSPPGSPVPGILQARTLALTIQTFVSKMMSLLFNTLSRFVIAFLPRGRLLVMAWLQSPSLVIQEPKIIKSVTASTCFPFIYHEAT